MDKQGIRIKIDVSKIDKKRIFKGKKGSYIDLITFVNEEPDQYGQNGFITHSFTKEEREAMDDYPEIVGNITLMGQERPNADPDGSMDDMDDDVDDGLPF